MIKMAGRIVCLGIESTAHTFGVGIVKSDGSVLSNVASVYKTKKGWGIIPKDAAEHHKRVKKDVLKKALCKAKLKLEDIDIVSFSQGPGLPLSLRVGMDFVKELSSKTNKPVYGVNHCIAHIEIGMLKTKSKDPVTLYVSGGNTQVIAFTGGRYRCFGETMDIAIGNALDMFARKVGMDYPGGPKIERFAKKGKYVELPYVVKGMDTSFTGIVSEAVRKFKQGAKIEDLCFSLQETCFAMLTEITERALAHTGKDEVLLTGGVAANGRLQQMLKTMCKDRGARFFVVPKEFAGDNGSMIAWTGILSAMSGQMPVSLDKTDIKPRWRTDELDIMWR